MRFVRDIALMVLMVLLQVFLFNEFLFFRFLNPYLYIYLVFSLFIAYQRPTQLVLAFILGGSIDLLEGSSGLHAAAAVAIAYLQPLIKGFWSLGREDVDEVPSLNQLSLERRLGFLLTAFFIHHLLLFGLEQFGISSFVDFIELLKRSFYSSLFSFTFILLYQLWNARR